MNLQTSSRSQAARSRAFRPRVNRDRQLLLRGHGELTRFCKSFRQKTCLICDPHCENNADLSAAR
jgi:hypothetical protein